MCILTWVLSDRVESFGWSSTCSESFGDSSVFQFRVGIIRSYELCERRISCETLKGCVTISEYGAVRKRSVAEARHREVL